MTTVLVAGATGWLGQQIAAELLNRGAHVRLMARGGSAHPKAQELAALIARGAALVDADVGAPDTLSAAVRGVDVIVSALQGGPDVVIDGQAALAAAGLRAGARRMFPSDYAVDFRGIADRDHLLFAWRKAGDAAIAATGLPQTNMFNGAFTEMLLQPFFGLMNVDAAEVAFWGDADQSYDFTATADAARYVAAAALDPATPQGPVQIAGDTLSPRQLAETASSAFGKPFKLNRLGGLDDLNAEITRRQATAPNDPMAWAGLQYHRAMASGIWKLRALDNARYPDIQPMTVHAYLRASTP